MTPSNGSLTTGRALNITHAPLERVEQATPSAPLALSSDTTRAAGDRALAQNLCNALANGFHGQTNIVIPPHSTLGEWQAQLNNALKNPEFQQWVKAQRIAPGSINLYPDTNQLTATVNNQTKVFTLDDQSGWGDVAGPVLAAAKIFAGGIDGPVAHYHINATDVPHWLVANFYGQGLDPASLAQLASNYTFAPPTESLVASRSEQALQNQRQVLGDINDLKTLRLKLHNKVRAGMRLAGFNVDPNSSHQPKGFTTAEDFITGKGWKLPTTDEGFDNLLSVLGTPVPQSPPLADFWGLLSTPVPLSTAQRTQLSALAQAEIAPGQTLFSTLMGPASTTTSTSPREQLEQMLTHPKALALGQKLEAELGVLPTPTSRRELVLSALVLSLDANAGATHNKIAQYQLDQPGNWGKKPADIVRSVGDHLVTQSRVQPGHKDVAAYLMLSHAAPALLVQGLPEDLRYGTHQWAALSSTISQIEHLAPGASATMSYQRITDLAELEPITDDEEKLDQQTRLEAMIDWAITNGALPKKNDGNYSASDITTAKAAYQKEFSDLGFAGQHLLKAIPTRRQMALDELKRVYGESINFERRVLQSIDGDQNVFFSLLDAHMAGKLVKGSWRSINSQVSMQDLEQKFLRLNNIPRVFESAADFHHYNLQRSEAILVQHLLAQLPETDQQHLSLGTQKFYSLRKAISGASHLVTQEAIEKGKGRHGIIIRSELGSDVRYYEVFPGLKKIVVRTDLPADLPAGRNVVPYSNFETDKRQAFDWDAYSSGTEPVANARSELIIEELIPATPWAPQPQDKTPGLSYSNSKTAYLASVAANQHLVVPKETFISAAAGESAIELQQRHAEAGAAAALGLIPFANTLKYAIEGKAAEAIGSFLTDATTLVLPAPKGLGTALRHSAKSLNTLRVMLTKATSHADDLVGLVAASNKNAKSFYSAIPSFGHKFAATNNLLKEASIVKGTVSSIGNGAERTALLAKFEGDKWYAVNPNTGGAYGTPLVGFRSDTSIPLQQETFAYGTKALVIDRQLNSDAYTIARSNGFDLVDGGKVYRYSHENPGQLTDLESVDHYKELDNFEATCSLPTVVGGRVRRGANNACFTKQLQSVPDELTQELQALEHLRLFPSSVKRTGEAQRVVFERRLYKMEETETGSRLVPDSHPDRITYKPEITGIIKNDTGFGLYDAVPNEALEEETRVIRLDSISDAAADKRELRGVVIKDPDGSGEKYLVIEADTAEFYYTKLSEQSPAGHVTFKKCTKPQKDLVIAYRNKFAIRHIPNQPSLDANVVALPKLDSAFKSMEEKLGYSKVELDDFRAQVDDMTKEQQREVIYRLHRLKLLDTPDIALTPNRLTPLKTPQDFSSITLEQQNRFYAERSKVSVQTALQATGLGPGNLVRSPKDKARMDAAWAVISWLRKTAQGRVENNADLFLKSGVGNCFEMSSLAKDIVNNSGGRASVWGASVDHAFTVIGGPNNPRPTIDFSEDVWKDAWIVDPWAGIACPARDYTKAIETAMKDGEAKGIRINTGGEETISPMDKDWIEGLTKGLKTPE
jgi:hypothetical protein